MILTESFTSLSFGSTTLKWSSWTRWVFLKTWNSDNLRTTWELVWNYHSIPHIQSLSRVRFFATPWIVARQASLSITNSRSSPRLTSIESVIPSSHLILSRPLLLLPPIPPSIRGFSNESTLRMRWPKYWSFSFSIIPSKEILGLISFRMDWLDFLAVQEASPTPQFIPHITESETQVGPRNFCFFSFFIGW